MTSFPAILLAAPSNSWQIAGWYALAFLSLFASAVYSGTEIGIFSLSRARLRLRTHHGDPAARQLTVWLEQPTYAIEGLLVLQNIFSFALSAAVAGIMDDWGFSSAAQVILTIAIVTPLVFVFCEVVPKDLFHTHADRWIYPLVPLMHWSFRCITWLPILPLVRVASRGSTWLVRRSHPDREIVGPRAEILALFQESADTGVMSGTQQDLVQRALRMARISIREVMIPWTRVVGVPVTISTEGFRALARHYNVSRLPILGRTAGEVLGFIEILDVLGDPNGFDIRRHLHPAMTLIGEQSVRSAITLMQRARQTIAIVVDRQGRAIGLVTMKDLIEELVGDLESW